MTLVTVKPQLLHWARERAGQEIPSLVKRFPKIEQWEQGEAQPTLKQLEHFAQAVHVPVGYLFLDLPPVEETPIPDLRTVGLKRIPQPSPDLLETIFSCQLRQAWYREFAQSQGESPLPWIGSMTLDSPIEETAEVMRKILQFDLAARKTWSTWTDALRHFMQQADAIGVLVMCSGIVGNNTKRKLNPEEFRGFAFADSYAPLVFINGADSKAAQMFTLAHELAHLWLGESALSDQHPASASSERIERWCNRVAAEFLVPLSALQREVENKNPIQMIK